MSKKKSKTKSPSKFTINLYNRIVPLPNYMKGPVRGGIKQYIVNKNKPWEQHYKNLGTLEEQIQRVKNWPEPYMAEVLEPFLLEDLKDVYLGMPQRYDTLEESSYRPINADPVAHYKIPMLEEVFGHEFLKTADKLKLGTIDKPHDEKYQDGEYFDLQVKTKNSNGITILPGLGHATIGVGHDAKGEYVSYYDKWDVGNFTPNSSFILDKFYASPRVYGRIYKDEYYNIPMENRGTTYLPEVTVTAKKQLGGTINYLNMFNENN